MGLVGIVPSNGWQPSICSSLRSEFTTGVSMISTGTEATFTSGASATTIMISSNRNAASQWPSGRAGRPPAVGVHRHVTANPEALTPTSAPLEGPDIGVQDSSGPVEAAAPVIDQPKPPTRIDKIELTIDSLQNYELLKPIRVVVESLGDKVFVLEGRDGIGCERSCLKPRERAGRNCRRSHRQRSTPRTEKSPTAQWVSKTAW